MRIRKIAAVILALVVATSLSVSSFASVGGYPSNPTASNPAPVTTSQVNEATTDAIKQAASSGGQAAVTLVNVSTVSATSIKNVFTQAARAGVANTVVHLDAREGGAVLSRVYVDATTASKLSGTVDFSVVTKGAAVEKAVNTFEKHFDNKIAAVSLGQKGAFGADIKMAVKADLSKLNTNNLVFYSFNKETGKYAQLAVTYKVDSRGYLHFSTPVGGDIIISDKTLTRK